NMLVNLFEEKPNSAHAECRRLVSSAALLCSLATSSYTKANNHVAIIEAWTIYLFSVLGTIEKKNLQRKRYSNEIEIAQTIIIDTLKNLFDEIRDKGELLHGDLMTDAFVFRHRITILLGLIAYLGMVSEQNEKEPIKLFLDKHITDMGMWGE